MANYYDMDGNQITLEEWSKIFESNDRFLAFDVLDNSPYEGRSIRLSTVWTGLAWGFEGDTAPQIFETMAFFEDSHPGVDLGCWRWSTQEMALEGHREILERIRDGLERLYMPIDDL